MIRLQFSTSVEWQSGIIRRVCHSPFSHVDIVLPNGNLLGSSNSPKAPIITGNAGGVAVRPPEYQEFGIRRIAEVLASEAIETSFLNLAVSQLGKPFDDKALHAFLDGDVTLPRDWRQDDLWFCSEYITWCLEGAGLWSYTLLLPKNRISPADLLLLLNPLMNTDTFWLPPEGLNFGPKEYIAPPPFITETGDKNA